MTHASVEYDLDNDPLVDLSTVVPMVEFSEQARELVEIARSQTRELRVFEFVASNYENAWSMLHWLRQEPLCDSARNPSSDSSGDARDATNDDSRKPIFCEWGSGMGVVTGLAALAGFEVIGIEMHEGLVDYSRALHTKLNIDVQILQGSYFDLPQVADYYYVYAWPGQMRKVQQLFASQSPYGARLLFCNGCDELQILARRQDLHRSCRCHRR